MPSACSKRGSPTTCGTSSSSTPRATSTSWCASKSCREGGHGRAAVAWAGGVRGQRHLLPSRSNPPPPPPLRAAGHVTAQPTPLSKGLADLRTPSARGDPARHKARPLGSPHPDPGAGDPDQWEPTCSGFWLGAWRACPCGSSVPLGGLHRLRPAMPPQWASLGT